MRLFHLLRISLAAMAIMGFAGVAQAAGLNVTHQIVSQQATATGSNVTVIFGIENQTSSGLTALSIELNDPMIMVDQVIKSFSFDSLAAGEFVTAEGTVTTSSPLLPAGSPIQLIIRGTDSAGQPVSYMLISTEGVLQ